MLSKSKTNRALHKSGDLSIPQLSALTNSIHEQQKQTHFITKEIKNQIELNNKNQRLIGKSIEKINQEAALLIWRFEEEKEINAKLQFLVKHIEEQLYQAKLNKATQSVNQIENDKLEQCTNVLTEKQFALQNIREKINNSSFELTNGIDTIRALRRERTIFSTQFDNIERQFCDLEHCYKVLVIERNIREKEEKEALQEFRRCEVKAEKERQKIVRRGQMQIGKHTNKEIRLNTKNNEQLDARTSSNTQGEDKELPGANTTPSEFGNEKQLINQKKNKFQNDMMRIKQNKQIIIILNDLGILTSEQLPQSISVLESQNQTLLLQASDLYEQILSLEQNIKGLNRRKITKSVFLGKKGEKITKNNQLTQINEQLKQNNLQIDEFRKLCRILAKDIHQFYNQDQKVEYLNEEEEIIACMSELQQFLKHSYLQPKNCLTKNKKEKKVQKQSINLLPNHPTERNHISIYEEKDLLDFAKKNLGKQIKSGFKVQK